MTIQELLKAQGLSDEQITAIATAMKDNKIYTAGEENLDIRYGKLKTDYDGLNNQYTEAQNLIAELKKSTKGNEDLQGKITGYENQVQALQKELKQAKLESAVKVALLEAKVNDIDYMTFKLKEKGELELDENEKIKGWDDKIAALKTQFPQQFENSAMKKIQENKLEGGSGEGGLTKAGILKMPYAERSKLFSENPEAYKAAMNK